MSWHALPRKLKFLIYFLTVISVPIIAQATWNLYHTNHGWYWIVLTVLAVLTVPFFLLLPSANSIIGIGDAYIMAISMMAGTSPCVIATFLHTILASILVRKRPKIYLHRVVFNTANMVCGAWLYSTIYALTNPTYSRHLDNLVIPAMMLTVVFFLFNSITTSTAICWASNQNIAPFWAKNCLPLAIDFSISSVSACFIVTLGSFYEWLPLAVAPFVGLVWGWNKVISARAIEAEKHLKEQEQLYLRTVESLAMAVDAKDQTTYGHIRRVKAYAMGLAKLAGLTDPRELMAVETGALLHDIGKLAIDDYILNKPGKLSRQEFEKMKLHSAAGDEILKQIQFPFPVAEVVRFHHERWDGLGYPDGLKGEEIPLGARILAIVDAYDAIRSSRPYKSAFGKEDAISLIKSQAGTVYDPRLADLFIAHIDELEAEAERATQDIPKLSFRKFFETVDQALSGTSRVLPSACVSSSATAELVLLFEFCNGPGKQLELNEILAVLAARIRKMLPYDTCAFFVNKGSERISPAYATGQFAQQLQDMEVELGKGISGWVMAYKRPMLNANPALELSGLSGDLSILTDSLVVPLIADAECVGTISLYAQPPGRYGQPDLALLQAVAGIVAPLVGRAGRFKSSEWEIIDPVTRTYRVGYLSVVGAQMLEQAEQQNAPLSMLLLEMRGLNQVITLYGPSAADSLLHRVAELLRAELRETDVLVRFGHEGFVALLPGVRGDQVARFSHRLQQIISSSTLASFRARPGLLDFQVGTASSPQDGSSVFALLRAAQKSIENRRIPAQAAHDPDSNVLEFPPRQ
jgi:diguanylate cyclase (GGDEF)-like protein/putative nucleotidyltransferase with HDIG domain